MLDNVKEFGCCVKISDLRDDSFLKDVGKWSVAPAQVQQYVLLYSTHVLVLARTILLY